MHPNEISPLARDRARNPDVLIVGGGPAGLATALFLVHADPRLRGRVLVLEKEHYPREKFCAGGIGARADQLLARIGVVVDVPSVPIDGMTLALGGGSLAARDRGIGRVVRRVEYDHALARMATERGVVVCEGTKVTGFSESAHGIDVETTQGRFRARVLVGADGVGSFVRRAVGLPMGTLRAQVIELDTEEVRGDPARDTLHFDASDPAFTGYAWDFPTIVDGKPLICRGIYHLKSGAPQDSDVDIHALLRERLSERGLDIDHYRVKRFAERGYEKHTPYARFRVMLVGEAAGIDALTGEGIAQAIAYGAFAGPYLAEKLAGHDFAFHDFATRLSRSRVGFELRVRARTIPYYFGPHRATIERFVLSTPDFFAMGLEHFAGRRLSRPRLARSALSFARQVLWPPRSPSREGEKQPMNSARRAP